MRKKKEEGLKKKKEYRRRKRNYLDGVDCLGEEDPTDCLAKIKSFTK